MLVVVYLLLHPSDGRTHFLRFDICLARLDVVPATARSRLVRGLKDISLNDQRYQTVFRETAITSELMPGTLTEGLVL